MSLPVVLMLGSEEHFRVVRQMYSGKIELIRSDSADSLESAEFTAAVLMPEGDDYAESAIFRGVCEYSAKKHFPILFIGNNEQLRAAYLRYPDVILRPIPEEGLTKETLAAASGPVKLPRTIAILAETPEIPAFLTDIMEENGLTGMRVVQVRAHSEGVRWMEQRKVSPDLLVICGNAFSDGDGFTGGLSEALRKSRAFRKMPYIVLHYSDDPPYAGEAPLAVLDIRSDAEEIVRIISGK